MGRWDPVYTDEQRAAARAALNDHEIPPSKVVKLAALGQLAPDLEPFALNIGTARNWRKTEAQRRRKQGHAKEAKEAAQDAGTGPLLQEAEASLRVLQRMHRTALERASRLENANEETVERWAKATREVQRCTLEFDRATNKNSRDAEPPDHEADHDQPEPASIVDHIAARNRPTTPHNTQTQSETTTPPTHNNTPNNETTNNETDAVSGHAAASAA